MNPVRPEFRITELEQLADQLVRFAPPARRLEHLANAERLLTEVDGQKRYPYQFVCFRITDYRPESHGDLVLIGDDLEHDLFLLIDGLSRVTPAIPVECMHEPVLTLQEMSQQLNVSTKTLSRWRHRGMPSRRVVQKGRCQIGFLPSVVSRFLSLNQERVERSSKFSLLTDLEREEILRRARRMSRAGCGTLTEVSRRIAKRLGRSPETVRHTIKTFDRDHPEMALFPAVTGPLNVMAKQTIFNSYRRGIPVQALAKKYHRTPTSMYRVIHEVRADRLLAHSIDYIYHPCFDDPSMEVEILGQMPGDEEFEAKRRGMHVPVDVPAELASNYEFPLLNREQEQHLFRKMNFFKHKAALLRRRMLKPGVEPEQIDPIRVRIQDLNEAEMFLREANRLKDLLVSCNMRLVTANAKRHVTPQDNLFELISDGNISLLRAVEKFDYSRGNKFSTYATWAIMKNFARSIPEEKKRKERYVTGQEEVFDMAADTRTDEHECLATAQQAASRVNRLLDSLDPRERQIIRMRAGLDRNSTRSMTLDEIGHELGITKERVRQLHVRSMQKLKSIAKEQHMELP